MGERRRFETVGPGRAPGGGARARHPAGRSVRPVDPQVVRARELRRFMAAVPLPLYHLRAVDAELRTRLELRNDARNIGKQSRLAAMVAEVDAGADILVGSGAPAPVALVTGLDQAALRRLEAAGLPPAAVVQAGPHLQAWVHLGRRKRISAALATMAARLVLAQAGESPDAASWQRAGLAPGFLFRRARSRVELFGRHGKPARAGREILAAAAARLEAVEAARDAAAEAGIMPSPDEFLAPGFEPGDLARVYRRAATALRTLGADDWVAIDRAIASAAMRAGAGDDQVRALIRAGAELSGLHARVGAGGARTYLVGLLPLRANPDLGAQLRRAAGRAEAAVAQHDSSHAADFLRDLAQRGIIVAA